MEVASNAIQNLRQQSGLKSKTSPNSSFSTFDNTDQHNDKQYKPGIHSNFLNLLFLYIKTYFEVNLV